MGEFARAGIGYPSTSRSPGGVCSTKRRPVWVFATGVLLVASALLLGAETWAPSLDSEPPPPLPPPVRRALEMEDWAALLKALADDPLTNSIHRLATVRALFETGRLPEDQFSWLHRPGPDLLSTTELRRHVGTVYLADTLLELGHLNAAERLAFNSLEMEGETPAVLRTLVRLHVVKGLSNAAGIFLNRLHAYPAHRAWVDRFRAGLAHNSLATDDPKISLIRSNLVTQEGIVKGLTTERLLRQALDANPENRMAFEFLMAHHLLAGRLLNVRQTLMTSPLARAGPLPRHYAEALLLHRQLSPGISWGNLPARVPPPVAARFKSFVAMMTRTTGSREQLQPQAWREFGNTYWYYYYFGPLHPLGLPLNPGSS
jgi:hypothetical protein